MAGGNRKAKHDIAPVVRASFLNALKEVSRREGKTFTEVMADWMQKDPIQLLNAVSKFTVRENTVSGKVEHDHKHDHKHTAVQETAEWIESVIAGEQDTAPEKPVSH